MKHSHRTQSTMTKSPFTHQVLDTVKMSNNYIVTIFFWKLGEHSQTQVFRRTPINPEIGVEVDGVGIVENFQKWEENWQNLNQGSAIVPEKNWSELSKSVTSLAMRKALCALAMSSSYCWVKKVFINRLALNVYLTSEVSWAWDLCPYKFAYVSPGTNPWRNTDIRRPWLPTLRIWERGNQVGWRSRPDEVDINGGFWAGYQVTNASTSIPSPNFRQGLL